MALNSLCGFNWLKRCLRLKIVASAVEVDLGGAGETVRGSQSKQKESRMLAGSSGMQRHLLVRWHGGAVVRAGPLYHCEEDQPEEEANA